MWMPRVAAALLAAPMVMVIAQAPPPPPPMPSAGAPPAPSDPAATVAVSGTVVDAATGAPIPGAVVEVSLEGRTIRTDAARPRATDERGRFVFTDLTAGTLAIRASAIGYLSSGFAAEGWSTVDRFPARAGEWVADIRVSLTRPGVIAGTVLDERNEPVVGVIVGVLEKVRVGGTERYMSGRAAVTDDRGRYRIIDLTPGDYLVQVPGSAASQPIDPIRPPFPGQPPAPPPDVEGRRVTYPSVFHPAVSAASSAQVVSVRTGETREGIDVRLEPTRATQLTGIIEGPVEWASGIAVRLVPEAGTGVAAEALETRADSAGRFVFDRVAEGTYTLVASRRWSELTRGNRLGEPWLRSPISVDVGWMSQDLESGPPGLRLQTSTMSGAHPLIATELVVVSGPSMSGLVVRARPLATMRGRVTRDVDSRYPTPTLHPAGGLRLDPVDAQGELGAPSSTVRPDDPTEEFSIDGIHPGRFHLRASYGWLIKSATWNGRDFTRVPFDATVSSALDDVAVVVTNAGASISGTVRGPEGSAGTGATVVLFPTAQERWTGDARVAPDGTFVVPAVAPGTYHVTAKLDPGRQVPAANEPGAVRMAGSAAAGPLSDDTLWGTADVQVIGQDIEGLSIVLQPGGTMSGRLRFAGTAAPLPSAAGVRLRLTPVAQPQSPVVGPASFTTLREIEIPADGQFLIAGLAPGAQQLSVVLPAALTAAGWWARSAIAGDVDLLDAPVEMSPGRRMDDVDVVLSRARSSLTGRLQLTDGRPGSDFFVMAFSTDPRAWQTLSRRTHATRPADDGVFQIEDMPPGDYFLTVMSDFDPMMLSTPGFFEQAAAAAVRSTLAEGEQREQSFAISR